MWWPFKDSPAQYLLNAELANDKFCVVKMASEILGDERKKYQVQLTEEQRIYVKKSIRRLTLKHSDPLTPAELRTFEVVREAIPELAVAYDFKEAFFCIYGEPDKQNAFEANSLSAQGLVAFKKLTKTVQPLR